MLSFSETFPSVSAAFSPDFYELGTFWLAGWPHEYALLSLAVLAVVGFYMVLTVLVGLARGRYGIAAPATSGHPDFERRLRVQVNTGEQLAPFFAVLAIFALVMGPGLATVASVAWLLGRVLYSIWYYRAPKLRYPGFAISMAVLIAMMIWTVAALSLKTWTITHAPASAARVEMFVPAQ